MPANKRSHRLLHNNVLSRENQSILAHMRGAPPRLDASFRRKAVTVRAHDGDALLPDLFEVCSARGPRRYGRSSERTGWSVDKFARSTAASRKARHSWRALDPRSSSQPVRRGSLAQPSGRPQVRPMFSIHKGGRLICRRTKSFFRLFLLSFFQFLYIPFYSIFAARQCV